MQVLGILLVAGGALFTYCGITDKNIADLVKSRLSGNGTVQSNGGGTNGNTI